MKDQFIEMNIKHEYRYFLESILFELTGVNRLSVLVYSNEVAASKRFKPYQKELSIIITTSSREENLMINQLILILKQYEEMTKLTL